ncbi:MAG TPA: DUF2794 domain-containing protein [Azospirillaceae bacterium]|nr:DUF2794 domain-containing protein [Azospirillaceae bacterium]
MTHLLSLSDYRRRRRRVYFDRSELTLLLALYSERVARGEWRDYAIDHGVGAAVFSVFRHTLDRPVFTVAKAPGRGGPMEYTLLSGRERLGCCGSLPDLLALFDRYPHAVPTD